MNFIISTTTTPTSALATIIIIFITLTTLIISIIASFFLSSSTDSHFLSPSNKAFPNTEKQMKNRHPKIYNNQLSILQLQNKNIRPHKNKVGGSPTIHFYHMQEF